MEEREAIALDMFGKPYSKLSEDEKDEIEELINLRKASTLKKEV